MAIGSANKEVVQTDDIFIGNENAPVTIVAYIDYECGDCALLNEILKELLEVNEDKIRINFRHFRRPTSIKKQ